MQIHELSTFSGTPSNTDYLAIDDGLHTLKIGAGNLGVTTEMTLAEATAGTITAARVITPKVLHDYVTTTGVTDVQVNGTSVTSSGVANIQDSDFLSAATIAKWDAILGL